MHISYLRTVGGSVMFAIPKPILEAMNLEPNQAVGLSIENGKITFDPVPNAPKRPRRSKYTSAELVAQCDMSPPLSSEDQAWLNAPSVGREGEE